MRKRGNRVTVVRDAGALGLTLDQVAAAVQTAMRAGASGAELPEAVVTFGGKLKVFAVQPDAPDTGA